MEEKRDDLKAQKQRKLLESIVLELGRDNAQFYYMPTIEVAMAVKDYVANGKTLNQDDRALLAGLDARQIQILLSLK
ncbi:MAG: hypothetical protein ACFBZ9_11010 [Sphingomonadales bacterium]